MDPNEQPPSWTGGDAPDKEKMEQIRARRLAKLGTATPASSKSDESKVPSTESGSANVSRPSTPKPQSAAAAAVTETPTPKAKINITSSTSSNPFAKLGVKENSSKAEPESSKGSTQMARKRTFDLIDPRGSAPQPRRQTPKSEEPAEDYTNRALTEVFRITVDPHQMTDANNHRLTFLPNLNQELNDAGEPLKVSLDNLDQAIMELLSAWPHDRPLLDLILPCWKRANQFSGASKWAAHSQSTEVLSEAKRLTVSACAFAMTMPDLYGRDTTKNHESFAPYLLRDPLDEMGLDFEFIKAAIQRFPDDDAFPTYFDTAMLTIAAQLSSKSMGEDYKPYVRALLTYCRFPELVNRLARNPCFNMAQSAPGIERHTILGPFFRLSPVQPEVIRSYFPSPRTLDKAQISNAQGALRMVLKTHQDDLFVIANAFIRASADSRNRTLDWFAYIMNQNHKRRALQVNPREVASDGFMLNVTTILDRFCEPFMDNDFTKIGKIDIKYFTHNPRVNISDETKINADQAYSDKYYEENKSETPTENNFITEIFFLTLAAHHYGSEATGSQLKNLDREIKYLDKHIKAMEAERVKVANSPNQLRMFEETLRRHVNVLEKTMAFRWAIEGAITDEQMQSVSLRFMRYVAVWLLRVTTQSDYKPGMELESIKLPLPAKQPDEMACLPEYILQNIVDSFKFMFRYVVQILPSAVGDEMIALCITLLVSGDYIKNPYLKSSLVTLLYSGTWKLNHLKNGVLGDSMISSKFANAWLLHALLRFYIDCESTGAHTQFFDKFNIRYEIFQVIKCIWTNDVYRQQLIKESTANKDFFVRFVNLLLNDATFVLDEAFTKFPQMRKIERELEDHSLSAEDRQKKEEELQQLGNQAGSYMQLANETLEMMKLFTAALKEAFTMPEIVSRLASMLNYNLDTLAGPKAAAELSVSNREKYHFRPIQLLADFVDIYLNLGNSKDFIDAVAADGRSYKPAVLERVSHILTVRHQKDAAEIAKFRKLQAKFVESKAIFDQAELDLGDIPPEFEDPIMGDLMRDPVLLPSKHIVDRSTIVQHLLSDPKDPFTRQPMTVDDAIPQTELKEKIQAWMDERARLAKEKVQAERMDTTEG